MERQYVTMVSFERGLFFVIKPDGHIGMYTQRGIKKLTPGELKLAIKQGVLRADILNYKEFPRNWSLVNEVPKIMGRTPVTFNKKILYM